MEEKSLHQQVNLKLKKDGRECDIEGSVRVCGTCGFPEEGRLRASVPPSLRAPAQTRCTQRCCRAPGTRSMWFPQRALPQSGPTPPHRARRSNYVTPGSGGWFLNCRGPTYLDSPRCWSHTSASVTGLQNPSPPSINAWNQLFETFMRTFRLGPEHSRRLFPSWCLYNGGEQETEGRSGHLLWSCPSEQLSEALGAVQEWLGRACCFAGNDRGGLSESLSQDLKAFDCDWSWSFS